MDGNDVKDEAENAYSPALSGGEDGVADACPSGAENYVPNEEVIANDECDADEELTELLNQQQTQQPETNGQQEETRLAADQEGESESPPNEQIIETITSDVLLALPMVRVDFETLLTDTPQGVDIPVCIAGPLLCMLDALRCELNGRPELAFFNTILDIENRPSDERLDNNIANWLIRSCRIYNECIFLFAQADSLYAFIIALRILNLIEPKLFPVSLLLARQAEQTDFYSVRMPFLETRRVSLEATGDARNAGQVSVEDVLKEDRREILFSVINNLYGMVFLDLYHIKHRELRDIVRLVFLVFQECLREYAIRFSADVPIPYDRLYSVHLVQALPHHFGPILGEISLRIGRAMIKVPPDWLTDVLIRHYGLELEGHEVREFEAVLVKKIVENILTVDSPMVFGRGKELGRVLFHNAPAGEAEKCVCRLLDHRLRQWDYSPHVV